MELQYKFALCRQMKGSVFFELAPGINEEQEEQLAIFLYTWFIFSVAFPVMFLGLLDRKWVEDSYYVG